MGEVKERKLQVTIYFDPIAWWVARCVECHADGTPIQGRIPKEIPLEAYSNEEAIREAAKLWNVPVETVKF